MLLMLTQGEQQQSGLYSDTFITLMRMILIINVLVNDSASNEPPKC